MFWIESKKQRNELRCFFSFYKYVVASGAKQSPIKWDCPVDRLTPINRRLLRATALATTYCLLSVSSIPFSKRFEFHDTRLFPYSPGDDLFGMLAVIGFDDGPSAVGAVVAAPFEVMEITGSMDLLDDRIAVTGVV